MYAIIFMPIIPAIGFMLWRSYRIKRIIRHCIQKNKLLLPDIRSPKNMVIVFDLHGVVFRHDYKKMMRSFWKSPDKWRLLWATIHPQLWIDVFKIARNYTVPEAFIMQLTKQHETIKQLLPTIIHIMNAQKPHQPTVELIHRLKKEGYHLDIISNIGETIYKDLEQLFPDILGLFDTVIVTCAGNGYISKPNPQLYYLYLASMRPEHTPLFIDDKIKNIQSALDCGIASMYYASFDTTMQELKTLIPL